MNPQQKNLSKEGGVVALVQAMSSQALPPWNLRGKRSAKPQPRISNQILLGKKENAIR
ncbi:MAG: hypothetical protein ACPHJ3_03455 [Rubripirellula sp.]